MIIDGILKSIDTIPAFPATIQKVIELLRDEDYAVNDLVNVIKYDQAVTANILKISNSAYFGVRQKIKTIPDAVIYLGQQQLVRAMKRDRLPAPSAPGSAVSNSRTAAPFFSMKSAT